jgi:hypothetical protein
VEFHCCSRTNIQILHGNKWKQEQLIATISIFESETDIKDNTYRSNFFREFKLLNSSRFYPLKLNESRNIKLPVSKHHSSTGINFRIR